MKLGNNLQLAVDNYKKFLTSGAPRYVGRIIKFVSKSVEEKFEEPDKDEVKVTSLRLTYMHLNGNKFQLGDDFWKLLTTIKKKLPYVKVTSTPSVLQLLEAYDENPEETIKIFNQVFYNVRRTNGNSRLREIAKELP